MGFGPRNNRRYSERHERELCDLYLSGLSLAAVRAETGVPDGTVWEILKRNGVKRRVTGRDLPPAKAPLDPAVRARTLWLHEQGCTYAQIAKIMGIGVGGVHDRIVKARIETGYSHVNRGANNRSKDALPAHVERTIRSWGDTPDD